MTAVSLTRRIVVWVVVVSFAIAAIGGIAVLLGAELGETAGRVLLTTAVVGVFSIAVLCCAALLGRALRVFGLVGVAVAIATLALAIVLIWSWRWDAPWAIVQLLWSGCAATTALSLGSLLLLLADRRRPAVRWGLWVTLGLFALVLALVIYLIWAEDVDSDVFTRVLGILAILAALGAVTVPVLSLLLPEGSAPAPAGEVSAPMRERLRARAAERGLSVDELVAELLDRDRGA